MSFKMWQTFLLKNILPYAPAYFFLKEVAVTSLHRSWGPVYFCWLDCHRGQQLLSLDTNHNTRVESYRTYTHSRHSILFSYTLCKRHQLVRSLLTTPFLLTIINKRVRRLIFCLKSRNSNATRMKTSHTVTQSAEKYIFKHSQLPKVRHM